MVWLQLWAERVPDFWHQLLITLRPLMRVRLGYLAFSFRTGLMTGSCVHSACNPMPHFICCVANLCIQGALPNILPLIYLLHMRVQEVQRRKDAQRDMELARSEADKAKSQAGVLQRMVTELQVRRGGQTKAAVLLQLRHAPSSSLPHRCKPYSAMPELFLHQFCA